MRALITGGAGFIGSHLAEVLLDRGDHVSVVDDLSTGRIENIQGLKGRAGFSYTIDTIQNRAVMAELVDDADVVFHLAAAVGVRLIIESPVQTIETNVKGTELVLELAAKKRKTVMVASTSEVYGKANVLPFSEDNDIVLGPTSKSRWSYACSKAIDEFLAIAYWREKKLPVTIVRLFNTVGPRQTGRYGMVIPSLVKQAIMGQALTVFGDGEQSRCFGHVRDVVEALVALIQTPDSTGEIFNVGSDREITINSLAELVCEMTESSAPIVHMSYDDAYADGFEDMRRRVPDLTKIRRLIGYAPRYDIRDILRDVIEHMRNGTGGLRS